MKLLRLYKLHEAGQLNKPTREPKKKHQDQPAPEPDVAKDDPAYGHDEDGNQTYGGWPDPSVPPDDGDEPTPAEPTPEAEPETPFASTSAKPSAALQGGKAGAAVKADKLTLEALQTALESVRTRDDDLQDWIDDVIREIGRAIRSGADLTLPKFEATPGLDDFDEDDGGGSDEDY